jgi:hypothetical protein
VDTPCLREMIGIAAEGLMQIKSDRLRDALAVLHVIKPSRSSRHPTAPTGSLNSPVS